MSRINEADSAPRSRIVNYENPTQNAEKRVQSVDPNGLCCLIENCAKALNTVIKIIFARVYSGEDYLSY